MIGGWLTIRYRPSTSSPSFDSACRLSRVCAFSRIRSAPFAAVLTCFSCRLASIRAFFGAFFAAFACVAVSATTPRTAAISVSSSRCAYQMSIVCICPNSAIASR